MISNTSKLSTDWEIQEFAENLLEFCVRVWVFFLLGFRVGLEYIYGSVMERLKPNGGVILWRPWWVSKQCHGSYDIESSRVVEAGNWVLRFGIVWLKGKGRPNEVFDTSVYELAFTCLFKWFVTLLLGQLGNIVRIAYSTIAVDMLLVTSDIFNIKK